jgi:hypothetical protein
MRIDPASIEGVLLISGVFGIVAAWVPRILLFTRDSEDTTLNNLLDKHSVMQFGDLLAIRLFKSWSSLAQESKRSVAAYAGTYLLASSLFLTGFVVAYARHWL